MAAYRSRARGAGALAVVALLSLAGTAAAAELRRGGDAMALILRTDGSVDNGASFKSSADITAALGSLNADLGASVQTGRSLADADSPYAPLPFAEASSWHATGLSFAGGWSIFGADLSFAANEQTRRLVSSTETVSPQPLLTAFSNNDERSATFGATFHPTSAFDVQVGAQSSQTVVGDRTDGTAGSDQSAVFSTLTWRASSAVAVEVGTKVARTAVAADRITAGRSSTTVRPRVAATIDADRGTKLRLAAERVVEPLQPWFVTAIAPFQGQFDISLRPESEWRLQAAVDHRLSPMLMLSTGVVVADRASGLETAADGYGGQALTQTGPGTRREVDVTVAADLARIGLDGATLTGSGAWRSSAVSDPLTNSLRRVSGERPYEGRIVFAQSLPVAQTRWGFDGYVSGPTELFGFADSTHVDPAAGLGGFLEYAPGTVRLKLRADNLIGSARVSQTSFYSGVREATDFDRLERRVDRGPTVTLSLTSRL